MTVLSAFFPQNKIIIAVKTNTVKIINRLCKDADNLRGKTNQEDDITFVVVKAKKGDDFSIV